MGSLDVYNIRAKVRGNRTEARRLTQRVDSNFRHPTWTLPKYQPTQHYTDKTKPWSLPPFCLLPWLLPLLSPQRLSPLVVSPWDLRSQKKRKKVALTWILVKCLRCEWSVYSQSTCILLFKMAWNWLACVISYFRFDAVDKGVDFDKAMEKIAKDAEK